MSEKLKSFQLLKIEACIERDSDNRFWIAWVGDMRFARVRSFELLDDAVEFVVKNLTNAVKEAV